MPISQVAIFWHLLAYRAWRPRRGYARRDRYSWHAGAIMAACEPSCALMMSG